MDEQKVYKILRPGRILGGGESLILGKAISSKFIIYARIRPNLNTSILTRVEVKLNDTLQSLNEYNDFNPTEDCYLVRKVFKDSCNYMYYSRSTINGHDSNYGFNLLSFNKNGDLLNNQVFNTQRPVAIYDIDIDEQRKIVSGNGQYFDNSEQFSFTASLKKQTVNSTETLEDNESILISNISNVYLNVNPVYQNKIASIYNIKGQKIKEESLQNEINISNLTTGIYIIQVSKNGYVKTEKFVKI